MLPFLKPKRITTVMMNIKKPGEAPEMEGPADEPNHALLAAAEDLIRAVHGKDASAVAEALQAAWEICDGEPESEDEQMGENA